MADQQKTSAPLEDRQSELKADKASAYILTAVTLATAAIAVGIIYIGVVMSPFAFIGLVPVGTMLHPLNNATRNEWQRVQKATNQNTAKPNAKMQDMAPENKIKKSHFLSSIFGKKAPKAKTAEPKAPKIQKPILNK